MNAIVLGGVLLVVGTGCRIGFDEVPTDAMPPDELIELRSGVLAITTGFHHTCAIADGAVWCWGVAPEIALPPTTRPVMLDRGDWNDLRCGTSITDGAACCGERSSGVQCRGNNTTGVLGDGTKASRSTFAPVASTTAFTALDMRFQHACGLDDTRKLWCWGANFEGQLGQGDPADSPDAPTPVRVGDESWQTVSTGQGHTCAIDEVSRLFCWGRNTGGELGIGTRGQEREPMRVGTAEDWIAIATGQNHTCGIRAPGTLWCWGLIDGEVTTSPTRVGDGTNWIDVDVDTFHSCALRADRTIACWGRNLEGQLGVGHTAVVTGPTPVTHPGPWRAVVTGRFVTCAVAIDDSLWCTGDNTDGQLGVGDTVRRHSLTRVALDP